MAHQPVYPFAEPKVVDNHSNHSDHFPWKIYKYSTCAGRNPILVGVVYVKMWWLTILSVLLWSHPRILRVNAPSLSVCILRMLCRNEMPYCSGATLILSLLRIRIFR